MTTDQQRQPAVLLRGGAVFQQRAAAHRIVDAHQRAEGTVAGRDFFNGQGVGHIVGIAAAPGVRYDHAQQAQLAHLRHHGVIDPARLLPGRGVRADFAAGEVARHVADHALFFVQFDIVHCESPAERAVRRGLPEAG
ncbi:hypothetical protein D9M73_229780 [compost metagenome]